VVSFSLFRKFHEVHDVHPGQASGFDQRLVTSDSRLVLLSKIKRHCRLGGWPPQRPQNRRSVGTPVGQAVSQETSCIALITWITGE